MPNWCQNVIYVSHEDKNKMVALKDAIINGEMCDHIKPMPDEIYSEDNGDTYVFKFDTAWSPPIPVYEEMENQGFKLLARYVEYGVGYAGHYQNGQDFCTELKGGQEVYDEHLQSEYA